MKIVQELKRVKKKAEDKYFRARSRYIKYYDTLPIDDKCILLESQHGTEISGNIFHLCRCLCNSSRYAGYKLYVACMQHNLGRFETMCQEHGMEQIKLVVYASNQYFRLLASAKYLINDNTFDPCFIKREGQVYLNTWHGTPLKALGRKMNENYHNFGNAQKNFITCDYLLCPNRHTMNALVDDYMVRNLSDGKVVFGGYPRNSVFFDEEHRVFIQEKYQLKGKRVYAYMPTFRGSHTAGGSDKGSTYMHYYLYELDKQLKDDELLFVNIHPVAKKNVDFDEFRHIRNFPEECDTYEFLNAAQVLITDYSSVFFDFACTRKKIVLFAYDREEYLHDRGMYLDMDVDLPFPKVYDLFSLLRELRTDKQYDDQEFLATYAPYEGVNAAQKLCDFLLLGEESDLILEDVPANGKENVVIYAGNLAGNGITTSLRNFLNILDTDKRNYYITFKVANVEPYKENIKTMPEKVGYFSILGDMNVTIGDRIIRRLFKQGIIKAPLYMRLMSKRIKQDWLRCFGGAKFDTAIQFNGYENEVILLWSQFDGNRIIFVHSDMKQEIITRSNQRKDVLSYAYRTFDHVAAVTPNIVNSAQFFAPGRKIEICHNAIDALSIREKSYMDFVLDKKTEISRPKKDLDKILSAPVKKFVSVGRFSPEKGHKRLVQAFARLCQENSEIHLIIVGGVKKEETYQELVQEIHRLGMEDHVTLVYNLPNPFPMMRQCDCFILSSFYEGFGLVLAEADVCGLPVISTDIDGPRAFMQENGGTLVENSEEGLYQGMRDMLDGKVKPMSVDYEAYNQQVIEEFEALMRG